MTHDHDTAHEDEHDHEHEHGPLAELVTVRDWLRYAVTRFNQYRRSFPPIAFAGLFGYTQDAAMLEVTPTERAALQQVPAVKF